MESVEEITFPSLNYRVIRCPVCGGNKCVLCDWLGELELPIGDPRVKIQRHLILQFFADNYERLSREISMKFDLQPQIHPIRSYTTARGDFSVYEIIFVGTSCWIITQLDLPTPMQFFNEYIKYQKVVQKLEQEEEAWLVSAKLPKSLKKLTLGNKSPLRPKHE